MHALLAVAVIVLAAHAAGAVAVRCRQPAVLGEMVVGIVAGPTVAAGAIGDRLFPHAIRPVLSSLSDVGLALFMFTVGCRLESVRRRRTAGEASAVAAGSLLVPFVLGVGLALLLAAGHPERQRAAFVLFLGVALATNALPVMARLLADRPIGDTFAAELALGAGALCDALIWAVLGIVVVLAGGSSWRVLLVVPYLGALVVVGRPLLGRVLRRPDGCARPPASTLPVVVAAVLASAAATDWMGLHPVFGAFLVGAVLARGRAPAGPRGAAPAGADADDAVGPLLRRLEPVATAVLLPAYFVTTGMNVDLTGVVRSAWWQLVLVLAVAVVGKGAGTYAGARLVGFSHRRAAVLATLMNTRGLTEIVVLGVGLQVGLLDRGLYSVLIVVALVTTAMTAPLLGWLSPTPDGGAGAPGPAGSEPGQAPRERASSAP